MHVTTTMVIIVCHFVVTFEPLTHTRSSSRPLRLSHTPILTANDTNAMSFRVQTQLVMANWHPALVILLTNRAKFRESSMPECGRPMKGIPTNLSAIEKEMLR